MVRVRWFGVIVAGWLLLVPSALAWGPLGHRVIARLAWQQLTPQARAAVTRLLETGDRDSLAAVAAWPDAIRDQPQYRDLWQRTRHKHYVNFADSACDYVPQRDCADGDCVVAAISDYESRLANTDLPAEKRLRALIFVVHFIGDVHQPLHAGYRGDAGGNARHVHMDGEATNLHHVWDSSLLRTRDKWVDDYVGFLQEQGAVPLPDRDRSVAPPVQWAEESCRITRHIYPDGDVIDSAYVETNLPIADKRLRQAGKRLAQVLNRILG